MQLMHSMFFCFYFLYIYIIFLQFMGYLTSNRRLKFHLCYSAVQTQGKLFLLILMVLSFNVNYEESLFHYNHEWKICLTNIQIYQNQLKSAQWYLMWLEKVAKHSFWSKISNYLKDLTHWTNTHIKFLLMYI